jgi:hypothetical protein
MALPIFRAPAESVNKSIDRRPIEGNFKGLRISGKLHFANILHLDRAILILEGARLRICFANDLRFAQRPGLGTSLPLHMEAGALDFAFEGERGVLFDEFLRVGPGAIFLRPAQALEGEPASKGQRTVTGYSSGR